MQITRRNTHVVHWAPHATLLKLGSSKKGNKTVLSKVKPAVAPHHPDTATAPITPSNVRTLYRQFMRGRQLPSGRLGLHWLLHLAKSRLCHPSKPLL